ncbi:MAG: sigma-54-dependent Fis family transcriptional regulator [Clostridia bacterium]|nr:sigma-54-dependent Fis family transcriptional regulator [Clostridia bacterium]
MSTFNIIVVDDEASFRDAYCLILSEEGYGVKQASSGAECLAMLNSCVADLIITDIKMPKMNGIELLEIIKAKYPSCEVIIVTGYGTVEGAVEAVQKGAFGYFVKGQDPELLLLDVAKLFKIKALQDENINGKLNNDSLGYILETKHAGMKIVLDIARKSAASDANILILGESGTGKEVMAKFIHHSSPRRDQKFIPVNCQTFSEGILESELFGHEKGSFTGAIERRVGRWEDADKGTLFLDEIGEISQQIQAKLLRVIENKSFERIGSNKTILTNSRLITATSRNLQEEMTRGSFREDLFYRINTITINIPPLRDRKEDLEMLIDFFLSKFLLEGKRAPKIIEEELMNILLGYNYPGNIRELRNIIERLVVLSDDSFLHINHLPDSVLAYYNVGLRLHSRMDEELIDFKIAKKETEIRQINQALKNSNGNVSEAAKLLGISRRHLTNRISLYNIKKS